MALFENWVFTEATESMAIIEMGTWTQDRQTDRQSRARKVMGLRAPGLPQKLSLAHLSVYTHREAPSLWPLEP